MDFARSSDRLTNALVLLPFLVRLLLKLRMLGCSSKKCLACALNSDLNPCGSWEAARALLRLGESECPLLVLATTVASVSVLPLVSSEPGASQPFSVFAFFSAPSMSCSSTLRRRLTGE
uniref:(northern house mosquito) hypothetical protein n=1 Tax=Culex pipiens TaxID=7175 RepID=A0A8D8B7D3_CULPI